MNNRYPRTLLIVVLFLFCMLPSLFSADYSQNYTGLSLEFQKNDIVQSAREKDYLSDNNINLIFIYGPEFSDPLRFRAGAGMYELSKYYINGGIELKIFEFLNSAHAKAFGFYLIGDLKMGLDYVDASAKAEVFVPVSSISGIQLGVGVQYGWKPFFCLSYSAGVYPLITD